MHPTPKRRGRPSSGTALSGAERQRRYRERQKARHCDANAPASIPVTRNEKPGNPEHRRLFAIPQAGASGSTALVVPQLPEARTVTGDREVDAMLWLKEVCQTARDVGVLDRALEAASRIKTPMEELERRYTDWLKRQPGAHPLAVALSRIGEIEGHVTHARQRILLHAEGLAIFGSYETAMSDTAPERMLAETAALPEDFTGWPRLGMDALAEVFARSVNPHRLSECASELHYWDWLYRIRARMTETEHPDAYVGDDAPTVVARREYVEGLLTVLAPVDRQEAIHLADALKAGLVDIGSTDDGTRRAEILDHLLRTCP